MKTKKINRTNPFCTLTMLFVCIFLLCIFSCNKTSAKSQKNAQINIKIDDPTNTTTEIPLWVPGTYPKVAVVFGYGFETAEVQTPIIQKLEQNFGLAKDDGLIVSLTFPEAYFSNKKVRNAWLYEALQDQDVFAIITLAAPERTHYALATLQDNAYNARVYSIFPQDDILGTESGSELVLDYKNLGAKIDNSTIYEPQNKTEFDFKTFEEESQFDDDITKIIIPLIRRIKSTNNRAIPEDASALAAFLKDALQEDFFECTVNNYVDAQTGIASQNHFVFGAYDE